eukprot:NODE_826_length_1878_cov_147.577911_g754_i0.p1 GENE.NODE_826_length_1878_cov_147.577911_g754_i0~~NODE_826_length_1878_cov_147.577911_g754_i0.p1  ORF type:complete len:611 (-),score=122.32 NODE_826_length_1878_cov_147.577911_g754_i0:44-1822(-)
MNSRRTIATLGWRKASTASPFFQPGKDAKGNKYIETSMSGFAVLRVPQINKGAAFTLKEREELHLSGLLPPAVKTQEQQIERTYRRYLAHVTPIEKYQYLRELQERNEHLYFALLSAHLEEMLPIIYTPTVGDACRQYSYMYNFPRGLSFSPDNIAQADEIISRFHLKDVRMIVATDSSAILGIGDQGYGGMGIPVGKLALYTAAGGVSPFQTCPVVLDVGTNGKDLLEDGMYLGTRQKRLVGREYMNFMEKFVKAVKKHWPQAIIQWEDLSKDAAFTVLERFRDEVSSFNDDIQGTGAVTLAGVVAACRLLGTKLSDQVFVISGAGAGGAGVAWVIREGLIREGLSREEANRRVLVLDSAGLLYKGRARMEDYKNDFAQPASVRDWAKTSDTPTLFETVVESKATCLLGLSGIPGQFSEALVRQMARNTSRPIIFPLSNPTSSCEALPVDIFEWSQGQAIVATGSPFEPVVYGGKEHFIGQGNNAFVFPGLGAGAILAGTSKVTDNMIMEGAYALADYTTAKWVKEGRIFPPVSEMRQCSVDVALRVVKQAIADGVATSDVAEHPDLESHVRNSFWQPTYPTVIPRAFGSS